MESFGTLKAFCLRIDSATGNPTGYGLCVYQDPSVTDIACAALNGAKFGDSVNTLAVSRTVNLGNRPKTEQLEVLEHCVFVGELPCYLTEADIMDLLESFGPLRGFNLVKERETGNSKGYALCVYQDSSVTDIACAALNGIKTGDKTLAVRRAVDSEQELQIALQRLAI
ncbi:splicing factor U2af large subunit B [Eutrema salsugineum]|uniref:splicing factor U2af large subunit B n=1 Tax=Eutrema salsugineum TaxID=72664 RepID=UPI000CED62EE|nr:splicing factor U2af large subunit B [Eutrema salsugineum]